MIFNDNLSGLFIFLFSIFVGFMFLKKNSLGALTISGWAGLFAFSIPIFINKVRKVYYYAGEEYYLITPSLESKLIYFLFWLGFAFALYKAKDYERSPDNSLAKNNQSLSLFNFVCFINLIFYIIYHQTLNNINLISLTGKWLFLFLLIGLMLQKRTVLAITTLLAVIIYAFLTLDRTLVVISFVIMISFKLHDLLTKKKNNFFNLLKILLFGSFVSIFVIFMIIYTKVLGQVMFADHPLSWEILFLVFDDLYKSFEPLLIYGHTLFALEDFYNFDKASYIISILSNLTMYPSYFGLSSNYYNLSLTANFPDISFGIAGSIYASTFLGFGYVGLLFMGYFYGLFLLYADFRFEFYKNSFTIFIAVVAATVAVYIHRNALDNFLSIVRQHFILYFFIKIQTSILYLLSFNQSTKIKNIK